MYKIIYQKKNGQLLERIRFTLPKTGLNQETSMGWIILDILYKYGNNYYTKNDYRKLINKRAKRNQFKRNFIKYVKKYCIYAMYILYVPLLTLYFVK